MARTNTYQSPTKKMYDREQKTALAFGNSMSPSKRDTNMSYEEEKRGPGLLGQQAATRRYAQTKIKPYKVQAEFFIDTTSEMDAEQTENNDIAGIIGDVQIHDEQRSIRSSNQGSVQYGGSANSRVNNQLEVIQPRVNQG